MRTPIKLTGIVAAAALLLITLGCNKAQLNPKPCKIRSGKNAELTNKSLHCRPWRDAADAPAAVIDLEAVGVCNTAACSGGTATYSYAYNKYVRDGSGSIWYFPGVTTVSVADQNTIWNNAVSHAMAGAPPGANIATLYNFRAIDSGFPFLVHYIQYDVIYVYCSGGGGDPD